MPIYEYTCANCGHHFETLQKITDRVVPKCPQCGSKRAKRELSPAGFQLKGTGWYATDFKDKAASTKGSEGKEQKEQKTQGDKNTEANKKETKTNDEVKK